MGNPLRCAPLPALALYFNFLRFASAIELVFRTSSVLEVAIHGRRGRKINKTQIGRRGRRPGALGGSKRKGPQAQAKFRTRANREDRARPSLFLRRPAPARPSRPLRRPASSGSLCQGHGRVTGSLSDSRPSRDAVAPKLRMTVVVCVCVRHEMLPRNAACHADVSRTAAQGWFLHAPCARGMRPLSLGRPSGTPRRNSRCCCAWRRRKSKLFRHSLAKFDISHLGTWSECGLRRSATAPRDSSVAAPRW